MVWVKLDDQFFRNPKARAVGKDGRELFLAGLCYCAGALTDGFIATYAVKPICADADVKQATVTRLVNAGLWREVDGGYQVNDWRVYNKSASEVRKQRAEGKERAERSRERKANEDRTGASGSRDPSSSRPPDVVSSSSSTYRLAASGEEEDWALEEAKRRLAARSPALGPVNDPAKWLRTTAAQVRAEGPPRPALAVVRNCENPLCTNGWLEDPDDSTKVVECECRRSA